jgi:hypothetical protein
MSDSRRGEATNFWSREADVLIFSYGSTMAASVMKERCPGAEYYGIASFARPRTLFPAMEPVEIERCGWLQTTC